MKLIIKTVLMITLAAVAVSCATQEGFPVPAETLEECVYNGNSTDFTVWSPAAEAVQLRLYKSVGESAFMTVDMKKSRNGLWKAVVKEDIKGSFYTFSVCIDGKWLDETAGIAAKAVGVNGDRKSVV